MRPQRFGETLRTLLLQPGGKVDLRVLFHDGSRIDVYVVHALPAGLDSRPRGGEFPAVVWFLRPGCTTAGHCPVSTGGVHGQVRSRSPRRRVRSARTDRRNPGRVAGIACTSGRHPVCEVGKRAAAPPV
jgi:hypothetical protein